MLQINQVILTFLTTVFCFGQTIHISGDYLDQKANPIPDVRVRYLLDAEPIDSAFTDAEGHFVLTLEFTGLTPEQHPSAFNLGQNYPNPFNPSTQFTVTTPVKGQVVIYNILGQTVDRLSLPAKGRYTLTWGGANTSGEQVPAGVYLYALQTAQQRQVHKMVLLDGGNGQTLRLTGTTTPSPANRLSQPADPTGQLEFTRTQTTPLTLPLDPPDTDTDLGIISGNVGPRPILALPDTTLDLNDTLYLNLNDYFYNDDSTRFRTATAGMLIFEDTLLVGLPIENPRNYSVMARDPTDTTLTQTVTGLLQGMRADSLRFIQDIPDLATAEDEPVTLDLTPCLYNPYGDSVFFSWVNHDHLNGSDVGLVLTITPESNWAGITTDIIIHAFNATVPVEAVSNPFSVQVMPVNDPPQIDLNPLITSLAEDTPGLPDTLATFAVTEVDSGDQAPFYLLNDQPESVFARITWNAVILDSLAANYNGNPNLRLLAFDSQSDTTVVSIPFSVLPRADVTLNIRTLMEAGTPIMDNIESTFQIGDSIYTGVGTITKQVLPGTYEIWAENDSTGFFDTTGVKLYESHIAIREGTENPLVTPALATRSWGDTISPVEIGTQDRTLDLYVLRLTNEEATLINSIIDYQGGIVKPNTATPECYIDTSFAGFSQPSEEMVANAQYVANTFIPTISEGRYTPVFMGFGTPPAPNVNGPTVLSYRFDATTAPPGFNFNNVNSQGILYNAGVLSHATWNDLPGLAVEGTQGFQGMQGDPPGGAAGPYIIMINDLNQVVPTPFGILMTRIRDYFNPGDNL